MRTTAGLLSLSAMAPVASGFRPNALPKVLILGDSISIGYTPFVKELLAGTAEVVRPDENCAGTTHGIKNVGKWLGETRWDVIHFNFGLHDIKHVDPVTGKNSTSSEDPRQAEPATYEKNLKAITKQLKASTEKLIFATTTPFPDKPDGPLRRMDDLLHYNEIALKIMKRYKVGVNDLYSFALPSLASLQLHNNVHFTKEGSRALAGRVAEAIRQALQG